ncbi:MAG TPA: response regulator [Solirubrobacteraceae bacterium]|nr:response regulator [Solirubrobacteraceae bacterium]
MSLPSRLPRQAVQQPSDAAFADGRTDIDRFFDLSLDVMGVSNAEGRFVQINPAFERTLGYSLAEFTARPFMDFVHPDDVQATGEKFAALRTGEGVVGFENRYRCKDGSYRWLLWSASPMHDGLTYAVARDVTEQKHMEEELRASREQAAETSRSKWEFLGDMSHELRTPLNGVIGMIQLLRDTSLDPDQIGYIDAQEASAERLLAVLDNVLHFSKLEAGGLELDRSDFELRPAVEQVCQMLDNQAHAKGLKISCRVDAKVPLTVTGDRARLCQILLNLISNAVKFTVSGEVALRVAGHDNNHLQFSVSDTGIGIDEERASTLFEGFAQVDRFTSRQSHGSGLGLAVARQLVELMGGRIGAEPRETGGSVFWFSAELPEAHGALAGHSSRADPNPSAKSIAASRDPLVLLAEDDEINRIVAQALLTKLGLQTAVAHNGREAIEMAASHDYDVILMDCMMPVVDGLQATRQIRAAEGARHVPIIAMTALAMPGDRERCLAAGMDDYLSKPIRLEALDAALHQVAACGGLSPL